MEAIRNTADLGRHPNLERKMIPTAVDTWLIMHQAPAMLTELVPTRKWKIRWKDRRRGKQTNVSLRIFIGT